MIYNISDRNQIIDSCNRVSSIIENVIGKNCINNITKNISNNAVQNLIYISEKEDKNIDSTILKMILRSCIAAESKSSGSGNLSLALLNYFLKNIKKINSKKDRQRLISDIRKEVIYSSAILSKSIRKLSSKDIDNIVESLEISSNLSSVINDVILNCEIGTDIIVKPSSFRETVFKKNSGNKIKILVSQLEKMSISSWKRDYVNTLMIDGIIEEVSQIHHLLEVASSKKEPFVIICREASEEVKRTIYLNNIRRTIDLMLVETGFDTEYHHFFNDMSALFNCDFVNIAMGDTISSKVSKIVFVLDRIEINSDFINFKKDEKDEEYISKYVRDIQNIKSNFDQNGDPDTFEIISTSVDKRVEFLSSKSVEIKVGKDDINFNPFTMSRIDNLFRSFPDMNLTGIVDFSTIDAREDKLVEVIISNIGKNIATQRQLFQSLVTSFKLCETIIKAEKVFTIA